MAQSIKGARASRHFPACIFSMCIARPGCQSELLGWTWLLGIPFPLVCAMSLPSGQGSWAWPRCFGRRDQPGFPLPSHRAGGKCLRTQLLIPALQRSWRSISRIAGDGHLAKDTDPRINPYWCLWVLLVSLPFSQSVDKTLYICAGFFAIHQPSKHLGRVRVRHQPTDGQFFPSSSTFVFSFQGSFLQWDALADPSFTSPSNLGKLLKQGGEAACPWGQGCAYSHSRGDMGNALENREPAESRS